jgi:hypothetical protein
MPTRGSTSDLHWPAETSKKTAPPAGGIAIIIATHVLLIAGSSDFKTAGCAKFTGICFIFGRSRASTLVRMYTLKRFGLLAVGLIKLSKPYKHTPHHTTPQNKDKPMYFNATIASHQSIGVDGAIMLHHIAFFCQFHAQQQDLKYYHGQRYWMYHSLAGMEKQFSFWSKRQIERVISNLVKAGFIIKDDLSSNRSDRTLWYSLTDQSIELFQFLESKEKDWMCISPNGEMMKALDDTSVKANISPNSEMSKHADALPVQNPLAFHQTGKPISPNGEMHIKENDINNNKTPLTPQGVRRVKSEKAILNPTAQEAFDAFWLAYPKQSMQKSTERNFAKALAAGATPQQLVASAHAYAKAVKQACTPYRFIINPAKFLDEKEYTRYGNTAPATAKTLQQRIVEASKVQHVPTGRVMTGSSLQRIGLGHLAFDSTTALLDEFQLIEE